MGRVLLVAAALLGATPTADACPKCRDGLLAGAPPGGVSPAARGFAYGIYLLLPLPFLMAAGVGVVMVNLARAEAAASQPAAGATPLTGE